MKTAARQILTFSIWIAMLAGTQLLAQQTNLDKRSSRIPSQAVYVAQQQESAAQSSVNPTYTLPSQNPTPTPAVASQTQQSDSVPGTIFPGVVPSDQNPEAMPDNMPGVETGLWDGAEPGNCCAVCGGGYCTPPCWYTEQGIRIMTRSRPRNGGITYDFGFQTQVINNQTVNVPIFIESMSAHDANFNAAPGYNATIGRYLGRDSMDRDDFLEFTYWGMNTWFASAMNDPGVGLLDHVSVGQSIGDKRYVTGKLNTQFIVNSFPFFSSSTNPPPGFLLGVVGFDSTEMQHFIMDSEMHNWELNLRLRPRGRPDQLVLQPSGRWRRECQPGTYMSYLVGLRYMTIGEGFHFHSAGSITRETLTSFDAQGNPVYTPDAGYIRNVTGDYNILTENDLLGLQIGTDLMFRRCKWAWGVRAKVGPYVNFARNVKDIVNNPQDVPTLAAFNDRFSQRRQGAALIGEVGIEATYKFKPNLMGRAAYDFTWISGLALGSEQATWDLDPGANDTINTGGTIYSHGITLALEWCW